MYRYVETGEVFLVLDDSLREEGTIIILRSGGTVEGDVPLNDDDEEIG